MALGATTAPRRCLRAVKWSPTGCEKPEAPTPWLRREDVTCYRVYDADIPEYAAAIDVYEGRLHIAEYAAPKEIPEQKAAERFADW